MTANESIWYDPPMSRPSVVYQAVNRINGKRYVGVTSRSLKQRIGEHHYEARCGRGRCIRFHRAIAKYGASAFCFSTLAVLPDFESACDLERRVIAAWAPEYNIGTGGDGNPGKRSAEFCAKQSANSHRRGKPGTFLGRSHTAEARAEMSAARKGREMLPAHAKALRTGMLGAAARRRKPVICITTGQRFASALDACQHFGWKPTVVANAISKQKGNARGFAFKYEAAS